MKNTRSRAKRGKRHSAELTEYFRSIAADNTREVSRLKRNVRRALMEELTERQRQMTLMYYGENMTVTEIADTLDVYPSTVCRTIKRAEKKLRKFLKYGSDRILLSLYDD